MQGILSSGSSACSISMSWRYDIYIAHHCIKLPTILWEKGCWYMYSKEWLLRLPRKCLSEYGDWWEKNTCRTGSQKNWNSKENWSLSIISSCDIRTFRIPKLNLEATVYCVLVNWLDVSRLEPQITCKFKKNDLKEYIKTGSMLDLEKYHYHKHAFKVAIGSTDAARSVCRT